LRTDQHRALPKWIGETEKNHAAHRNLAVKAMPPSGYARRSAKARTRSRHELMVADALELRNRPPEIRAALFLACHARNANAGLLASFWEEGADAEPEHDGEPSIGWTEREARFGRYADPHAWHT